MNAQTHWSDEDLMAYADDQLDAARRTVLEVSLRRDAALRERVARFRAQRERVAAAYAPVLDEAVPERLSRLLAQPAQVVDLSAARSARAAQEAASARAPAANDRTNAWLKWGGLAASLLFGIGIGLQLSRGEQLGASQVALRDGQLVATGSLDRALTTQLASGPPAQATAAVQLTFADKAGRVCRTFSSERTAGLACREAERWVVQQTVALEQPPQGAMRQAASALPRELLEAIDRRIDGAAFDAARERQARDRAWQVTR